MGQKRIMLLNLFFLNASLSAKTGMNMHLYRSIRMTKPYQLLALVLTLTSSKSNPGQYFQSLLMEPCNRVVVPYKGLVYLVLLKCQTFAHLPVCLSALLLTKYEKLAKKEPAKSSDVYQKFAKMQT
jgi:hypothetical protein